ncbi:MAG: hypothetical protein DYG89_00820 [Caldilinea sp. CFX5]|nr:hypothetical protein [Caldilinea sp. CFX5]
MLAKAVEAIVQFAHELHTNNDPILEFLPWDQVESWLVAGEWEKLRFLLRKLPLPLIPETPEFFFVRGHALWGQHRLEEARQIFEKAHYFYRISCDKPVLASLSCLEIADLAHAQRHYQDALHALQTAETLLAATPTSNPYITARYHLVYSVILHDLGRLQAAIDHAQVAYHQFEFTKEITSQLLCLIAIASAAVQLGRLDLAADQTTLARRIFATKTVPTLYYARILNAEVHIAWHRGQLLDAQKVADELCQYASVQEIPHQQLYATTLLGHLQRALGNYAEATAHYDTATALATKIGYDAYLTELTLQRAWLAVLTGATEVARAMLQQAATAMTIGQWMSANLVRGVADLLEGVTGHGEELLTAALSYQTEYEAAAVTCALHCYLALAAFRNGAAERGQHHAHAALRWLNEHHLAYFPQWWHPTLLAEWATYALEHCPAYDFLLHQICVNHLGDAAITSLTRLHQQAEPPLRVRSQPILDALQQNNFVELTFVKDDHIRAVLLALVAERKLRRAGLPLLFARLTTAEQQGTPNPTLVAVFGLYLAGLPREAIAKRLGYSLPLVRNYISEIYARFDVTKEGWPKKRERWERLRLVAQEAGFV